MNLEELQNQEWLPLALLIAGFWGVVLVYILLHMLYKRYDHLLNRLREWEKTMSTGKRRRHERREAEYAITSALENALHEGKLTQETKDFYYKLLGEKCGFVGLLRRKLKKEGQTLKEELWDRLGPDAAQKVSKLRASKGEGLGDSLAKRLKKAG